MLVLHRRIVKRFQDLQMQQPTRYGLFKTYDNENNFDL
jgi:hypothetical protein